MAVGIRELRNRTAEVIAAVHSGQRVTLNVNGSPVADIVPHARRAPWLSGATLLAELHERAADHDLAAADSAGRARRADTLALARTADPIPITGAIMVTWARLVADCGAAGVHRAVKLTDSLIAATAVERGLPVVARDVGFDALAACHPPLVILRV